MPFFHDVTDELRVLNNYEKRTIALILIGGFFVCFNFTVYFFFNDAITRAFFPLSSNNSLKSLGFLILILIGYLSRPLGGIVMADLGDRFGRKPIMLLSLIIIAVSTLLISILPTYEQIGTLAIVLLLSLRFIQGFGFGAEVPTSWVFLAEHMPRRHLGSVCAMLISTFVLSTLLGNILSMSISAALTPSQLESYGWRIPFMLGALGTFLAVSLRRRLTETPIWLMAEQRNRLVKRLPLKEVFRRHHYGLCMTFGLSWFTSSVFVIVFLIIPALGIKYFDVSESLMAISNGLGILFATIGTLIFGYFADRFNVGRIFIIGCILLAVSSWLFFSTLQQGSDLMLVSYSLFGFCAGVIGLIPSICVRLFPVGVRLSGIAFTYNIAYALTGTLTPYLLNYFSEKISAAPLLYLAFLCVMGCIMGIFLVNLHGLHRLEDYHLSAVGNKKGSD